MACMCGDLCCSSCGPAQGNHRCPICGAWASDDPCGHYDEETGKLKPEFAAELAKAVQQENEAVDAYYKQMLEDEQAYKWREDSESGDERT